MSELLAVLLIAALGGLVVWTRGVSGRRPHPQARTRATSPLAAPVSATPVQPARAPATAPGTGPKFGLHYRDADGEETNRLFTLHEVQARIVDGAPWPYAILGWCHLRKEERTFAVSRIISLFEVSTQDLLTEPAAIRGLLRILSGPTHTTAQDRRFEGLRARDRADAQAVDLKPDEQPRVRIRWRTAGGKGAERTTPALVVAYAENDRGSAAIFAEALRGDGAPQWYFLSPQGSGVRHVLAVETDSGETLEGEALAAWVAGLESRAEGAA